MVTLICMLLHNMSLSLGVEESGSRAETGEGDEAVVSALAVGLTGWISHNLEKS